VSRTWFSVDEIAHGPQPLTLRVQRGPTTIERWASLLAGARRTEKAPTQGSPLLLSVLDGDGHPVPSGVACWRSETTDTTHGLADVRDGRAAIPRPVGASRTWVEVGAARAADGHVLPLGSAKAGPFAADVGETEVRLPPERVLVGRVIDPSGRGVGGLRVRAMRMDAVWRTSELERLDDEAVARTDVDGRFRIGALPDEPMRIAITAPSAYVDVWPIVTRPGDAPLEIRLRLATTATLTLVHADGRPATNAWVYATAQSDDRDDGAPYYVWTSRTPSATTDGAGVARLRGLDPEARYVVTAGARDPDSKERAHVEGWTPKDSRVVLAGPRAIRGVVRDPKGQPVAQARVTKVEGRSDGHEVETAADGTFSFEADAAETPRIHAALHEGGWGPQSAPVTVTSRDEPVVLVIETGVDLAVRVDGEEAANRSVGMTSTPGMDWPSGRWIWTTTDADGRARVRGLPPDRGYVLWIRPSSATDDISAYAEGASASAAGPELRVSLAKGGTIRGRLKGLASWSRAYVDATRDGMSVDGKVQADGTFEIRGLPDLEWTIGAQLRSSGAAFFGETKARPGADVVVEVKPDERWR
jgi:hypothetical protein